MKQIWTTSVYNKKREIQEGKNESINSYLKDSTNKKRLTLLYGRRRRRPVIHRPHIRKEDGR
jgi:hypothetical protein